MSKKFYLIVNPNSGLRKAEKDWTIISSLLTAAEIEFTHVFTKHKNHAYSLALRAIEDGYMSIIAVGGDGTLNEVVNGILSQNKIPSNQIQLGMIPIGTGNDWGKMYGIPKNYKAAIEIIKKGKTFIQDAGMISYYEEQTKKERYFVNIAGMGFDAFVAKKTNRMKEKGRGGSFAYLINLILGLLQYKFSHIKLNVDGEDKFDGQIFSICAGLCKFNGGGMMQLPDAVPDNAKFDITLIKKAKKFKVIRNIKNLYDGTFVNLKEVETYIGQTIEIDSNLKQILLLEADGESLGHPPYTFEMLPKSICVIIKEKAF